MKSLTLFLLSAAAVFGQPTTPLSNLRISGTNNVVLDAASIKFGTTTPGSISGADGALSFTAAGSNRGSTFTTSGTGGVTLVGAGSATLGLLRLPAGTSTIAGGIQWASGSTLYPASITSFILKSAGNTQQFIIDTVGAAVATSVTFNSNGDNKWDIGYAAGSGSGTAFEIYNRVTSANALSIASATSIATFGAGVVIPGTNTLKLGAIAAATIGVSADLTSGVFTFTAPSAGSISLVGATTINGNVTIFGGALIKASGDLDVYTAATNASTNIYGGGIGQSYFKAYGSAHATKAAVAEIGSGNSIAVTFNASGNTIITSGKAFQVGNAAVVAVGLASTHYIVLKDSTGTDYKVAVTAF